MPTPYEDLIAAGFTHEQVTEMGYQPPVPQQQEQPAQQTQQTSYSPYEELIQAGVPEDVAASAVSGPGSTPQDQPTSGLPVTQGNQLSEAQKAGIEAAERGETGTVEITNVPGAPGYQKPEVEKTQTTTKLPLQIMPEDQARALGAYPYIGAYMPETPTIPVTNQDKVELLSRSRINVPQDWMIVDKEYADNYPDAVLEIGGKYYAPPVSSSQEYDNLPYMPLGVIVMREGETLAEARARGIQEQLERVAAIEYEKQQIGVLNIIIEKNKHEIDELNRKVVLILFPSDTFEEAEAKKNSSPYELALAYKRLSSEDLEKIRQLLSKEIVLNVNTGPAMKWRDQAGSAYEQQLHPESQNYVPKIEFPAGYNDIMATKALEPYMTGYYSPYDLTDTPRISIDIVGAVENGKDAELERLGISKEIVDSVKQEKADKIKQQNEVAKLLATAEPEDKELANKRKSLAPYKTVLGNRVEVVIKDGKVVPKYGTTEDYEVLPPTTNYNLRQYLLDNQISDESVQTIKDTELFDEKAVDGLVLSVKIEQDLADKALRDIQSYLDNPSGEGGAGRGVALSHALMNSGYEAPEQPALGTIEQGTGLLAPMRSGIDVAREQWDKLSDTEKRRVALVYAVDPYTESLFAETIKSLNKVSEQSAVAGMIVSPITVFANPFIKVAKSEYDTASYLKANIDPNTGEVNQGAVDYLISMGFDEDKTKKQAEIITDIYKKGLINQDGTLKTDYILSDTLESLKKQKIKVTGEEWAIAGATAALAVVGGLAVGGALKGASGVARAIVTGIDKSAQAVFAGVYIKDFPSMSTEQKVVGAAMLAPIIGTSLYHPVKTFLKGGKIPVTMEANIRYGEAETVEMFSKTKPELIKPYQELVEANVQYGKDVLQVSQVEKYIKEHPNDPGLPEIKNNLNTSLEAVKVSEKAFENAAKKYSEIIKGMADDPRIVAEIERMPEALRNRTKQLVDQLVEPRDINVILSDLEKAYGELSESIKANPEQPQVWHQPVERVVELQREVVIAEVKSAEKLQVKANKLYDEIKNIDKEIERAKSEKVAYEREKTIKDLQAQKEELKTALADTQKDIQAYLREAEVIWSRGSGETTPFIESSIRETWLPEDFVKSVVKEGKDLITRLEVENKSVAATKIKNLMDKLDSESQQPKADTVLEEQKRIENRINDVKEALKSNKEISEQPISETTKQAIESFDKSANEMLARDTNAQYELNIFKDIEKAENIRNALNEFDVSSAEWNKFAEDAYKGSGQTKFEGRPELTLEERLQEQARQDRYNRLIEKLPSYIRNRMAREMESPLLRQDILRDVRQYLEDKYGTEELSNYLETGEWGKGEELPLTPSEESQLKSKGVKNRLEEILADKDKLQGEMETKAKTSLDEALDEIDKLSKELDADSLDSLLDDIDEYLQGKKRELEERPSSPTREGGGTKTAVKEKTETKTKTAEELEKELYKEETKPKTEEPIPIVKPKEETSPFRLAPRVGEETKLFPKTETDVSVLPGVELRPATRTITETQTETREETQLAPLISPRTETETGIKTDTQITTETQPAIDTSTETGTDTSTGIETGTETETSFEPEPEPIPVPTKTISPPEIPAKPLPTVADEEKEKIIKNPPPGTLCWIQGRPKGGAMYKLTYPPYRQENMFTTRETPKGYIDDGFTGEGSAFKSIKVLGGNPPTNVRNLDLGVVRINVTLEGGKPVISYAQDEDANAGERSKTIGMGAGQIPVEEWEQAKAEGKTKAQLIKERAEPVEEPEVPSEEIAGIPVRIKKPKNLRNWWEEPEYENSDVVGMIGNRYYRGKPLIPPNLGGNV